MSNPKPLSRATRWAKAASAAYDALETLKDLQSEYQGWRDNLPENLDSSPMAEKLDTIIELDLEGACDTVQEAIDADLPCARNSWRASRGFGRD